MSSIVCAFENKMVIIKATTNENFFMLLIINVVFKVFIELLIFLSF
jgi:hypothetical protein